MNNKKIQNRFCIRLLGPLLGVAMLLSACVGGNNGAETQVPSEPVPSQTVQETLQGPDFLPTEEATEAPTEEATEAPTEEPTEAPTEEPTEPPTEPTTPPQTGGSSTPGGTGGFEGGTTGTPSEDKKEEEPLPVPEAGTDSNAYAETLLGSTDSFNTVAIPAGGSVSYRLSNAQGTVLTIADADAYVVFNEQTHQSENGVVTVTIPAAAEPSSVLLQIGCNAAESKVFTLEFAPALGTADNPQVLESLDEVTLHLSVGQNAYYYIWKAEESGTLSFAVQSTAPEGTECNLTLTCGERTGNVSDTDAVQTIEVENADEVTICVSTTPAEQDVQIVLSGSFTPDAGSINNPIVLTDVTTPCEALIPGGSTVYYAGHLADLTLTATDAQDAYIILNGENYLPDDAGVITVTFAAEGEDPNQHIVFGVSSNASEEKTYTLTFAYPVGHPENPAELVIGENSVEIAPNEQDGYTYQWIAPADGTLTLTMSGTNWQYTVNNETALSYGELCDASQEPSTAVAELKVTTGDCIRINVNGFNPEDIWAYPGGIVTFTAAFRPAVDEETDETLPEEPPVEEPPTEEPPTEEPPTEEPPTEEPPTEEPPTEEPPTEEPPTEEPPTEEPPTEDPPT